MENLDHFDLSLTMMTGTLNTRLTLLNLIGTDKVI
jgi:hypothetical protein